MIYPILIFGTELGSLADFLIYLNKFIINSEIKGYNLPTDRFSKIDYINTLIPNNVYITITYPYYECSDKLCSLHLNLFDDDEISLEELKKTIYNHYNHYKFMLKLFNLPYTKPKLYSKYINV